MIQESNQKQTSFTARQRNVSQANRSARLGSTRAQDTVYGKRVYMLKIRSSHEAKFDAD
jgi:hypothetical protein